MKSSEALAKLLTQHMNRQVTIHYRRATQKLDGSSEARWMAAPLTGFDEMGLVIGTQDDSDYVFYHAIERVELTR